MNKPKNYDTEPIVMIGEYETLEPGGYICKILNAEVSLSKTGKQMLTLSYDIAEGEKKDYFKKQYEANTNENKKWKGKYWQLVEGESTKYFKGMIKAIEDSNPGFKFNFNENELKGKYFGGIFGREEFYNIIKEEYQFSTKLTWIRSVDTIRNGNFKIPNDKLIEHKENNNKEQTSYYTEEVDNDNDLPFNNKEQTSYYVEEVDNDDDLPF